MSVTPVPSANVTTQGMISPGDMFTDPATGMLTPVSFRFLFGLFNNITQLQTQIATLQQRLTNAGLT